MTAMIFCLPLLAFVLWSSWVNLRQLGLTDAFLLALALFFGAYTIIDVARADAEHLDPLVVTFVFTGIWIAAFVLWLYARLGPRWVQAQTSLSRLGCDWIDASPFALALTLFLMLAFRVYTAAVFGAGDFTPEELAQLDLPYWYTSVDNIAPAALYAVGLAAWAKALAGHGLRRWFWFCLSALAAASMLGLGRRAFLAFALIVGWTLLTRARAHRKRWLAVAVLVLSLPMLIAVSNVFQTYRTTMYRGVPLMSLMDADAESLLDSAVDVDKTTANLDDREAIWRFNYDVLQATTSGQPLQWGRLQISEIPNYIPGLFWPGKQIFDGESDIVQTFDMQPGDRATSVLAFAAADFGTLGMLVAPLLLIVFVWAAALGLRHLSDPYLRTMLMGFALYYAFNMETNYLLPIQIARDFVLVALIYLAARAALHVLRVGLKPLRY